MKKLALAFVLLSALSIAHAQNGNNICVFNALDRGGHDDLESAIKCSDEAVVNESTANSSKTYYYRGKLFTAILRDTVVKKKHPEASLEAIKAFKKLYDLNDPKF